MSAPARPRFRSSSDGYHREDVDAFVRDLADERTRLHERVADLEAVLDATVQILQARLAPQGSDPDRAGIAKKPVDANPAPKSSRRLTFVLAPVIIATSAAAVVLNLTMRASNSGPPAMAVSPNVSQANRNAAPAAQASQPAADAAATSADTVQPPHADATTSAPPDIRREAAAAPPRAPAGFSGQRRGITIGLSARNLCWIGVTLDGERRVERLMRRGETVTLQARNHVVLRAGNAGALALTINGAAAAPLGRQGRAVTTRITLANYKRLLAGPD